MTLQLNGPQDYLKIDGVELPRYREFCGNNLLEMSDLISAGRRPISIAEVMQRRLGYFNSQDVKTAWMDTYFSSGDAVIYHPNGDVKIVLDCQTLRQMTPQSPFNNGALVIDEDSYNALEGEVFQNGKLGKVNVELSRAEAKAHPVWQLLARDKRLLKDYTDIIFAEAKVRLGYDTNMGVYLTSCKGKSPEMRAFCVRKLFDWSELSGGVDFDSGRLVGVAPEAFKTSVSSKNVFSEISPERKSALVQKVNDLRDYIASLPDP